MKKISYEMVPIQLFIFVFWFKNGFIDKFLGIFWAIFDKNAYQGNSWAGWQGYIVGNWNKSLIGEYFLSYLYPFLFPILIILQCLPFIFIIASVYKGEFLINKNRPHLLYGAISSLFVAAIMSFTQTIVGASDGEYLWHFIGFSMIAILYIKYHEGK